jgi:hypothetical protein
MRSANSAAISVRWRTERLSRMAQAKIVHRWVASVR